MILLDDDNEAREVVTWKPPCLAWALAILAGAALWVLIIWFALPVVKEWLAR